MATPPIPGTPGPVDWTLAARVAHEVADAGDRRATADEDARLTQALELAEHWLDATSLPAPPDAGRTLVLDRAGWIDGAVVALRALVDPIATAAGDALMALATEQMETLGEVLDADPDALDLGALGLGGVDIDALDLGGLDLGALGLDPATADAMRDELRRFLARASDDPGALAPMMRAAIEAMRAGEVDRLLRPASAMLTGLQAGQVVGRLARQSLGHHDLGVPTAHRSVAGIVAVNLDEVTAGYDLDPLEVALVVATDEAAHRRLYHAVPWLEGHVVALVGRFAAEATFGATDIRALAEELAGDIDLEDADALRRAMERAATLRLEPNDAQRHVLDRLQTVVALVGAWARAEARSVLSQRLPDLARIEEVLRRRRASQGDGEAMLAGLLGLDLRPADPSVAEAFVVAVAAALGPSGLRRALAHPENLPEPDELADPRAWLARTLEASGEAEDLLAGLGEAPREPSAAERRAPDEHGDDGNEGGAAADPTAPA